MIGMIMIPTTTPATKLDCASVASARVSSKNGSAEKWSERNFATGTSWPCSALKPQHAEQQARERGQQVDDRGERAAEPRRRVLVDEQRHRRARAGTPTTIAIDADDQRALEQAEDAELPDGRVPDAGGEEVPDPGRLERRPRLLEQEDERDADDEEAERRRDGRQRAEDPVARASAGSPAGSGRPRRRRRVGGSGEDPPRSPTITTSPDLVSPCRPAGLLALRPDPRIGAAPSSTGGNLRRPGEQVVATG